MLNLNKRIDMKSQNTRLLSALKQSPLTTLQIIKHAGIIRPAARILELREQGHNIRTTMIECKNRFGDSCRVARYSL